MIPHATQNLSDKWKWVKGSRSCPSTQEILVLVGLGAPLGQALGHVDGARSPLRGLLCWDEISFIIVSHEAVLTLV